MQKVVRVVSEAQKKEYEAWNEVKDAERGDLEEVGRGRELDSGGSSNSGPSISAPATPC